jgi:capsid protein
MADRPGLLSRLFPSRESLIKAEARALASEAMAKWQEQANTRLQATVNQGSSFAGGWSRSTGGKWVGGQSKPIGGRITNHWGLRQQARDIVEDSVHAYTLVHRKADVVIDRGLALNPTPIASVLGITPEAADEWAQKVAESFEMWSSSKSSHRSGMFNFKQAQHQLMVGKTRDNDEFLRLYYSQRQDLLSQLQWEIIDANQIRGDALTATNLMPIRFYDGIERNPDGSERLYRIWVQPQDSNALEEKDVPRIGEKSGRVMMLHGFQPEYSGQGRGYSQLGVTIQEFELLEDYILSMVKKAINQSQFVAAIENEKNPPSNPWEQLGMPPAGPAPVSAYGATPAPAGVGVAGSIEGGIGASFTPVEEVSLGVPGSHVITSMAEGDKIKILENTVPGPDFDPFVNAFLTPLLGAHGMSIEMFKIKFEASYSAARGALAVLYRFVGMERSWLDTMFLASVYEMFLSCEIAAGRVSCPGWADPRLRAAWCAHSFIGSPPVQIDPEKEVTAAMKLLQLSATDMKTVTHEIGSGSYGSNVAANARDFPTLPIPPWEQKITVAAATMAESEEKQDQQAADLAKAASKAPAPGQNGNGKPAPARADAQHEELLAELRMTRATAARTEKRQEAADQRAEFETERVHDRLTAIEARPPETPQPITVTMPPITLETHVHNDGATETTVRDIKLTPEGELESAVMVKKHVPVPVNGKGKT